MNQTTEATEATEATAPEPRARRRPWFGDALERYALLLVWAATVVVFGILRPDTFLTTSNFTTIFGSQAILVVLTLARLGPIGECERYRDVEGKRVRKGV